MTGENANVASMYCESSICKKIRMQSQTCTVTVGANINSAVTDCAKIGIVQSYQDIQCSTGAAAQTPVTPA